MSKYNVCPLCGASLDHGEACDCDCAINAINIVETPTACTCQEEKTTE